MAKNGKKRTAPRRRHSDGDYTTVGIDRNTREYIKQLFDGQADVPRYLHESFFRAALYHYRNVGYDQLMADYRAYNAEQTAEVEDAAE